MLYKSPVWSKDGTRIIDMRYFIIVANEEMIERVKRDTNPKNVDALLVELTYNYHIHAEEVKPIHLDI